MGKKPTFFALLALLNLSLIATARAQTVTVGSPETVMSANDRSNANLGGFPDSPMGFFQANGKNYIFGANAFDGTSIELTSVDLNNLKSNLQQVNITSPVQKGDANSYDANYEAIAMVYYDSASGILIGMDHGEHWYNPPTYLPSYNSLGLAFSKDLGVTWTKLGEVITAQTLRANDCQVDLGAGTLVPSPDGYLYAYYPDEGTGCSSFEMAVARAKISDVIAAAQAGSLPSGNLFLKYYNGSFTQPGVNDRSNPAAGGGAFSPVFVTNGNAWFPNVAYNSSIQKYVMTYLMGWSGIGLRFSTDGINWSDATQVVPGTGVPPDAVFYPTLVNTNGGDPNILGNQFYVYYVAPFGDWSQSSLDRVKITVSGGVSAPAAPLITGITVQ